MGLEIASTSLLPVGSGMGTSSILGGCVLASVAGCVGLELRPTTTTALAAPVRGDDDRDDETDEDEDDDADGRLVGAVLSLEQLLTTGGGWQDQVGGLIGGGLKIGRSGAVPGRRPTVERVTVSPSILSVLNGDDDMGGGGGGRIVLAYTGRPRLARGVLRNVLRRWSRRTPSPWPSPPSSSPSADPPPSPLPSPTSPPSS